MSNKTGVLCHVSSLSSQYGIGSFGKDCYDFLDCLSENNFSLWQILPLNNTNKHNCPYGSMSSFSIDEMFVDVQDLIENYQINKSELKKLTKLNKFKLVQYKQVKQEKSRLLDLAFNNASKSYKKNIQEFVSQNSYVYKYAYYQALCKNNTIDWRTLNPSLWDINSKQAKTFIKNNKKQIDRYIFGQYVLETEWQKVKNYAKTKNIKIIGDMPIYPEVVSFDVFDSYELFKLNKDFVPVITGGVPLPNSIEVEQNWGTCVYDWDKLKEQNFDYMINKINYLLNRFDILRIDHFNGMVDHFEINNQDLSKNQWKKGGGEALFKQIKKRCNLENIVVENIGELRKESQRVLQMFNLKGMVVLQFIFNDNGINREILPQNVEKNSIYYFGTHDNNTFMGFLNSLSKNQKEMLCNSFNLKTNLSNKKILVECFKQMKNSNAEFVILQVQDVLFQPEKFRMNNPGQADDCWEYRVPKNYKQKFKKFISKIN